MVYSVLLCVSRSETVEVGCDFVIVVNLEELKVGARFEKVGDALGFLHAGKLKKDLACLVLKLLDVRSHNAELVDTGTEDIEGGVNLTFDLLAESVGHLFVGRV